jgi:hypothetical protein
MTKFKALVEPTRSLIGLIEKGSHAIGIKPPVTKAIIDKYTEDIAVDGSLIQKEIETREATSSTDSKGSIGSKGSIDSKGEDAVLANFLNGGFAAICSDDKRFIRRLRALDVPYVTPAVCIVLLLKQERITLPDAREKLGLLASFISSDEYHTVKWVLDTWRSS